MTVRLLQCCTTQIYTKPQPKIPTYNTPCASANPMLNRPCHLSVMLFVALQYYHYHIKHLVKPSDNKPYRSLCHTRRTSSVAGRVLPVIQCILSCLYWTEYAKNSAKRQGPAHRTWEWMGTDRFYRSARCLIVDCLPPWVHNTRRIKEKTDSLSTTTLWRKSSRFGRLFNTRTEKSQGTSSPEKYNHPTQYNFMFKFLVILEPTEIPTW